MVDISEQLLTLLENDLSKDQVKVKILEHKSCIQHQRTYKIKVKFNCDHCLHSWTSAQDQIIFYYYLNKNSRVLEYNAETFRQQCTQCKKYQIPDIYTEELIRVSEWFSKAMIDILFGIKKTLKGKPKESNMQDHHKKELCEACKLGKCGIQNEKDQLKKLFGKLSLGQ
ncbi:UNKNOWN [Stylonychia lemnae]|uniref:3CxxC-type domain-containing protein n=1 Tax=Stylonychia lemnae TaxID=5949 RepID=A0A078ALC1_STYLE|nr:UNKNOWN [Stylonychia lemnae]|eukprot:CDW81658.1 UNKNOWN [Stylonychia lemnae]